MAWSRRPGDKSSDFVTGGITSRLIPPGEGFDFYTTHAFKQYLESLKTWYCPFVDAWFDPAGARMLPVREITVHSDTVSVIAFMALDVHTPYIRTPEYQPIW